MGGSAKYNRRYLRVRAWRASSNSSNCSWLCRPSLALNMGYLL